MKKILLILMAALCAACATRQGGELRTGDLIFVALCEGAPADESSMDGAISASTGGGAQDIVHVGLVEVAGDTVWVIDATSRRGGVSRRPLDSFVSDFSSEDGAPEIFIVKRLEDNGLAGEWIARAKSFCGQPYDFRFLPDNGAMYCSELVRESCLDADGNYIFDDKPMNFKNAEGEYPEYWLELFGSLGMDVPQDVPGTNPQDMSESPLLRTVRTGLY